MYFALAKKGEREIKSPFLFSREEGVGLLLLLHSFFPIRHTESERCRAVVSV